MLAAVVVWCTVVRHVTASSLSVKMSTEKWIPTRESNVQDWSGNPILTPDAFWFEWILGDPTAIAVDGDVHLFANTVFHGIVHYVADAKTPTSFDRVGTAVWFPGSVRPYAFVRNETAYLFYEQYAFPTYRSSRIMMTSSRVGEWKWSRAREVLKPELSWETIGTERVGNPFVYEDARTGTFRLYYSASSVHLEDANIDEPIYIGLAETNDLEHGAWTRVTTDPIEIENNPSPDDEDVLGVGSLKFVDGLEDDKIAFVNQVTRNRTDGTTGSTISCVRASDASGQSFVTVQAPLIAPTVPQDGWKRNYVYGFDTLRLSSSADADGDDLLVYYNARDGVRSASETIGVSKVSGTFLRDVRLFRRPG